MVTGPRRAMPSVVYAIRTSASPPSVSSSYTTDENRLPPTCCETFASSRIVAGPQGVAAFFAMGTTLTSNQ
jgi:hypothetical protein